MCKFRIFRAKQKPVLSTPGAAWEGPVIVSVFTLRAVLIGDAEGDDRGLLVSRNGRLVAILSKLSAEVHAESRGSWFLEAALGQWCGAVPAPFQDLPLALSFIAERLGYDRSLLEAEFAEAQREFDSGR